jgi:chromosome segregation ATPase
VKTAKANAEEIKALTAFAVSNAKALANAKEALNDIFDKYNTLVEETSNLKTRIAELLEQNKNLNQERFNLSAQIETLTAAATTAKNDLANAKKNVSVPFAGSIQFDLDNEVQLAIVCACEELCAMLIKKNQSYGNSAFEPLRMFSKASTREQLLVRIDDKLSRLARSIEFPGDDTIVDLAGYLVLLLAHDSLAV